jgi:hypothetical protein
MTQRFDPKLALALKSLGHYQRGKNVMTKREYFKKLRDEAKAAKLAEQAKLVLNPKYKRKYSFSEISKGLDKFPRLITPDQLTQLTQLD